LYFETKCILLMPDYRYTLKSRRRLACLSLQIISQLIYRLSRARRCVENAFGILCSRWICLGRTLFLNPDRAQKIISACCYLHNYLITNNPDDAYCPLGFADKVQDDGVVVEGSWRQNIPEDSMYNANLDQQVFGRPSDAAKNVRDRVRDYVNSDAGRLPWQTERVFGIYE